MRTQSHTRSADPAQPSALVLPLPTPTHPLSWRADFSLLQAFFFFFKQTSLYLCVYAVAQSYLTLCNPMDCSPPGSSVHVIFQTRILKWVALFSSRGHSQPRDRTHVS